MSNKKIVLVTGATSGIGEGCAKRFAQSRAETAESWKT